MGNTVLSLKVAERLKRNYADTYKDKKVFARDSKGNIKEFHAGYFLKKFGSIVTLRKRNGRIIAYV